MERYPVLTAGRTARVEPEPLTPPRPRWMAWMVVLGLCSLAASIVIVTVSFTPISGGTPQTAVLPRLERRAVAVAYVDVEGGVRPLYPAVPGRVVEAPVAEGQEVEAGAVLLRTDDALPQARLKEAKVDLEAAKEKLVQAKKFIAQHKLQIVMRSAAVRAAKSKLDAAQAQATKAGRLFRDKVGGSKEDLDSANKLVDEAKEGVRGAEATLGVTESVDPSSAVRLAQYEVDAKNEQVQKADLGVRECCITAPCKGMVLRRLVNVGEVVGLAPNRPAIEFCPSGDRIVRAEVEQEFAGRLHKGQKAVISDDITGTGEWHGEVIRISDWYTQRRAVLLEPMQYNDIRTLEVIIRLKPDHKNTLRINQRVRVKLEGAE